MKKKPKLDLRTWRKALRAYKSEINRMAKRTRESAGVLIRFNKAMEKKQ